MSSPPGRAALAAVAALFILVSLATTAWWSGSLAGSERRSASIGLLGGVGCNKIGEKTCQSISLTKASGAFGALGMATFAFGVAAAVGSLGLGLFGLRRDPKERKLAPITLGAAAASVLMAIGFIVTKPKFINVPVSYGLYLGMLGFVAAAGRALLGLSAAPNRNAMQFHQAGMQGGYLHAAPQAFDPANPFGSPSSGQPASQPPPGFGPPASGQPPGFGPPASQPPPAFGPPPSQPPPGFGPPPGQPSSQPPPGFGPPASQPPLGFGPPASQPPPGFGPPASQPPPGFGPPSSQPPPGFGPPSSQPPGFGPPPGQPSSQPPPG
ncbi:MAG TPA: hypothetical protein PLF40_04585, partial [Kofleriaceae bacterium]|nr:hypothetical protein [Kofleriaceae bacterium]